ncbi:MAG: hypothetical protein KH031_29575 [Clostridiales bacterium]|nr:hypothetical protein [Clostridiales bacterium]
MYEISSLEPGKCFYYVFEYYYFQHLRVLKKRADMMRVEIVGSDQDKDDIRIIDFDQCVDCFETLEDAIEVYERNLKSRKEELSDIDFLFDELIKESGATTTDRDIELYNEAFENLKKH